jgi:hypothetical protein
MSFLAKLSATVVLVMIISTQASFAQEVASDYLGRWSQVHSNAGRCDRCEIIISGSPPLLSVKSNNGWTAQVRLAGHGSSTMLQGRGKWSSNLKGSLRGHDFSTSFSLRSGELYMIMTMSEPTARPRVVKGIFRREWLGS